MLLAVFCGNTLVFIITLNFLTLVGVGAYFCVIIKHTSDQLNQQTKKK